MGVGHCSKHGQGSIRRVIAGRVRRRGFARFAAENRSMASDGPLRGVSVLVAGAGLAGLAAARDLLARGRRRHRHRGPRPRRRPRLDDPRRLRRPPARRSRRRHDRREPARDLAPRRRARPAAGRASCAAAGATRARDSNGHVRLVPRSAGARLGAARRARSRRSSGSTGSPSSAGTRRSPPTSRGARSPQWLDEVQRRRRAARDGDRPARLLPRRSRRAVADRARRSVRGVRRRTAPARRSASTGGNDRLPAALAAPLGDRVQLGTEVVAVSHRGQVVRVSVKQARTLVADHLRLRWCWRCPPRCCGAFRSLRRCPRSSTRRSPARSTAAPRRRCCSSRSRFWRGRGRPRAFG